MTTPAAPEAPRILVVDDLTAIHEDFRKILAPGHTPAALRAAADALFGSVSAPDPGIQFTLDCAQQGQEALELVTAAVAAGRPYSVAFVDMRMPPGWDGLETTKRLWAADRDLQVVICTAYTDHSWAEMVNQLGRSDRLIILKKPFESIEVLQLAHALARKWEITRRDRAHMAQLDRTVTDRTRELHVAEERFAQAFSASPIALSIQSLEDGMMLAVNSAHDRIFGIPRTEIVGRTLEQLAAQLDPAQWRGMLERLNRDEPVDEVPITYSMTKGERRHLRASARGTVIAGRRCAVWAIRDVTEQMVLEQKFLQSQKMEAVGQLAAGIAHDFNNLLTVILSYTDFVLDQATLDDEQRTYLQQVHAAGERATALTRQLLVFSRRQVTNRTAVDFCKIIDNLRMMLGRVVPENIRLRFDCADGLPVAIADVANVEHVLMNLVVNARDAMPRGGQITLSAQFVAVSEREVESRPEAKAGQFVRIRVADNGSGIPPEVLPRIFEPFFTTKEVGKGTGLGLSTVYGIMRQHGGWVEVASTLGQGTAFDLYFPIGVGETTAPMVPAGASAATPPRGQGQRILIVEDDRAVRTVAVAVAVHAGYQVTAAEDGPTALALWRAAAGQFDLLVSDIVMPNGISGIELAQRLHREAPQLKIILTTGYSDELLKNNISALGTSQLLLKPYTNGSLLEAIGTTLAERSKP
jgi:PAS domain S-box-containing protein